MFETALAVGRDRSAGRRTASLSLALGAQASLLVAFTLASLFSAEPLPPPPLMATGLPEVPVRLTLLGAGHVDKKPLHPPEGPKRPAEDDRLKAPAEPPDHIAPPSDKGAPTEETSGPEPPPGWIGDGEGGAGGLGLSVVQPNRRPPVQAYTMPQIPKLVRRVDPAYPEAARAMRLSGRVVLQIVIDESGVVQDVQVLTASSSLFVQPAVDAVRQWRYTPPLDQRGQSVACYMVVTVRFVTD